MSHTVFINALFFLTFCKRPSIFINLLKIEIKFSNYLKSHNNICLIKLFADVCEFPIDQDYTMKNLPLYCLLPFICLFLLFSCNDTDQEKASTSTSQGLMADSAMVVSAHPLASQVGVEILKKGGNAVEAAIAVQFALAVVYPSAGNIGGGGFMVIRMNDGTTACLDFREMAPLSGGRNMYLDDNNDVIPDASTFGHLASGVPGSVDGMIKAYEKYGNLPFEELIQPAIDLAARGFALTEREAGKLNRSQDRFRKANTTAPEFLLKDSWKTGDTIYMTDLANTLELIRDQGRAGFYEGETADKIVAEMERGGGMISHEDLKQYSAKFRTPIIEPYKEYKIISMPPPSSGGIALVQLLKSIEPYSIKEMGHNSTEAIHLMAEAERRVYADRATHLGDADFYPVPIDELIDSAYIAHRMSSYSKNEATSSANVTAGTPTAAVSESTETTHFSVVDASGNAVSVTTTLNGGFGSKVVVSSAGFFLNNEMDDFSIKPGFPNMFGLVGGEANAIEPQKRMLSSMTPTIVEKDNTLFMVVGTPGGSTIITSVFQTILNVIDYDMGMQEAVNAKRIHHQWKPDTIFTETDAIDSTIIVQLSEMGHNIVSRGNIGAVDAILVKPDGKLEGGADPRGDDFAAGY